MGTYLNPGNSGFERIIKNYYVDKTGMIDIINKRIDTTDSLLCVTRPRRFGKSYAAQMLSGVMESSCKTGVPQVDLKGSVGSAPVLFRFCCFSKRDGVAGK